MSARMQIISRARERFPPKVGNVEETDIVDGIFELLGKSLFSARLVKPREVERYEVCPF